MREVWVDGGPESVARLRAALIAALRGGPAILPLDPRSATAAGLADVMAPARPVEPGTAVIIATSGSTGAAKGVLLSAEALLASARATHNRLGGPGTWLLATPPNYIGGLQVLVRAWLAGTTETVLDTSAGFRADDFAAAAATQFQQPGPHYTALVPTQLARLLDAGAHVRDAAAGFDAIVLGGARLDPALAERAARAGVTLASAYGMSETASGCVYDGVPLDGVQVRIGPSGRIEIAGDVLAHGYRLQPELTAESFVDGWFVTSDRGRIHNDGSVEVLGRADDVINTGGVKISAAHVEQALTSTPTVREACVVALPDPEWGEIIVAAVVAAGEQPSAEELRAAVRAHAGAAAVPKRVRYLAALPLHGPGKVDRATVRAALSEPPEAHSR